MKKWIGAEERVAVQFDDRRDPSAEITGCTDQPVFLTQEISLPLRRSFGGYVPPLYPIGDIR
jgi:hypothetical protein